MAGTDSETQIPNNPQRGYAIYPSLQDRVIVISGGSSGIGASMVESFATQGAQVVILDILIHDGEALKRRLTLADVNKVRHPVIYCHCDVTDIEGHLRPAAATILAKFPRIDAVINNAANDARMSTMEITPEQWDTSMDVNLRHVFFLTQALMPGLIAAAQSGSSGSPSVINMGSIAWAIPSVSLAPYIASKSAIVGLTKSLAHEFGDKGVRVNSIMPGAIATERQRREIITPEYEADILHRQALKRLLQPEEVARLALWLVADDSSGVTSQSFVLDAGWV